MRYDGAYTTMFLYCCSLVAAAFVASQCAGRLGNGYNCCSERCHALAAKQASAPNDIVSSKPLSKNPTALQKEKMQFLKSALSLNNKKLEIMLAKQPGLLSKGINGTERKLQYLQARLSLNKQQLSKMVQLLPSLLTYDIDENMEAKLQYLQKRLMLEEKELIKFVLKCPALLGFSTAENMEPKLEYFQKRLSMDDEQLRELFIKSPTLFGLSIELNLEPKIAFFESLIGVHAAKALLIANPSMLTRSLEKRMKPRVVEVQEAGLPIDAAALARIALCTEKRWTASVAYQTKKLLLSKGELW